MYVVPLAGIAFGLYACLHDTRAWITPRIERLGDLAARAGSRIFGRRPALAGMGGPQ
jgi:hypothetical protein